MTKPEILSERLRAVNGLTVHTDFELADLTTYKIGGKAAVFVMPETEASVGEALKVIHKASAPLFVLGWGSNVLISDEGWPGVVLHIGQQLSGIIFNGKTAKVLAGTKLLDLIQDAVKRGLGGMEKMAGIPGGIGGALRMNAGAFGQEIESTMTEVRGFTSSGEPFHATRGQINFGYRQAPELAPAVITSARFEFRQSDAEVLKIQMDEILKRRAEKQPLEFPSCGSVFKRPEGYYAGALIQEAGLKGYRHGRAMVSDKHAGFILNMGGASATEVYELIKKVQVSVSDKFGVELENEVKLIGFSQN